MRKIGLALATVAATAAVGTSTASAAPNPLDLAKLRVANYNCVALGGTPSLFAVGVDCLNVANLNISRQILASALCGALGWDFSLNFSTLLTSVPPTGYTCEKPGSNV